MRLIRANLNQIFCYSLNSVDTSKINQQFYVMSDFRFYTTHAYMHFFTDNSLLSVILFIFCWSFCILFSCNAYIRFPMHLYINEAGIFTIEKKSRLRKCEMTSLLFATSLCRRKTKPFAKMMKRISFIHLCAKERDSANGYIYLARCRRPASMRTDRRRSHTLLQYPTTLHQRKRPPGTNRVFRVWVFISKYRL